MTDLNSEWLRKQADAYEKLGRFPESNALRIAARVLDEVAVERVAQVIDTTADARTSYNEEAFIRNSEEVARAVIAYLKGEA